MTRYDFIGTGSMGSLLIRKCIRTGLVAPSDITASSKSGKSARALAGKTGITVVSSNRSVAETADVLVICVKPLQVRGVLQEIRSVRPEDKNLVLNLLNSIGAAVETDERNFDVYTDLTSCAPGLIAAMMKEFASAAVRTSTIQPGLAEYLVRETMIGTARILDREQMKFDDVIGRVATKGGTTEEGVRVLHARLPVVMDELLEATFAKRRIVTEQLAGEL